MVIIVSGIWFQFFYGGAASLTVTLALAAISYAAGRSTKKSVIVAAIAIWLGILSVRGGLGFHSYVRRELARPIADYTPFVSLIAPFRGLDQGLLDEAARPRVEQVAADEIFSDPNRS